MNTIKAYNGVVYVQSDLQFETAAEIRDYTRSGLSPGRALEYYTKTRHHFSKYKRFFRFKEEDGSISSLSCEYYGWRNPRMILNLKETFERRYEYPSCQWMQFTRLSFDEMKRVVEKGHLYGYLDDCGLIHMPTLTLYVPESWEKRKITQAVTI